jgi:t-SNARE complex subunit (syntaxin)
MSKLTDKELTHIKITKLEDTVHKMTKLLLDYSTISLEHTKSINRVVDIITTLSKRVDNLEADLKLWVGKLEKR